jgi:hypothetical protein
MAQVVEGLPIKSEALSSNPSIEKKKKPTHSERQWSYWEGSPGCPLHPLPSPGVWQAADTTLFPTTTTHGDLDKGDAAASPAPTPASCSLRPTTKERQSHTHLWLTVALLGLLSVARTVKVPLCTHRSPSLWSIAF